MEKMSFIARMKHGFRRVFKFLVEDMWRITGNEVSGGRRRLINLAKTIYISVRRFQEDNLMSRASALTYSTLLAVVPALALIFAIAKGFGFRNIIESQLFDYIPAQREALSHALTFVDAYLEHAQSGVFVGIGLIFLFWTVISLMGNVEKALNDIWQVKSRSFHRKVTDYTSMFVILPVLMIASSGLSLFVSSGINNSAYLSIISPLVQFLLSFAPYFLTCMLFTGIYLLVPNTKVKFLNAFIAGIICGTIFQGFQYVYISGQIWVSKYNAIYGSFAFLPLFLLWMQLSWLICLFGAVLSFSAQNIRNYDYENDTKNISRFYKDFFSILIASIVVKRFERGERPLTQEEISNRYRIPVKLTGQILTLLVETKILAETAVDADDRIMAYQPAVDINRITVGRLLEKIDKWTKAEKNNKCKIFQWIRLKKRKPFDIDFDNRYHDQWSTLIHSRKEMYRAEVLLKDMHTFTDSGNPV